MKVTLSHTKSGVWLPRVYCSRTKRQWCLNKSDIQAMDFLCLIKISAVINKLFIFLPPYWSYKMCFHSHFHVNNFLWTVQAARRGRDWCHKQSPDGITHTELLYWNSVGFARLETEAVWSSLLLRFPTRSHLQSLGAWNLWGVAFSRMHWLLHQRYWTSWGQATSTKLCLKRNLPSALQVSLLKNSNWNF